MDQYIRNLAISFIIGVLILSFISSDVIMPGYRPITIANKITNLADFPYYVFVSGPSLEDSGPGIGMCPLDIISENGKIEPAYKFCSLSVFAIEKEKWDMDEAKIFMRNNENRPSEESYKEFMASVEAKEVIKKVDTYEEVPESSTITEKANTYTIDLEKVKIQPDNVDSERNYWKYILYFGIPLIALVFIILKVRKKI